MTERPLRNVAASVRQRLMNTARKTGRPFQEVLQYFAMERFLYRLSLSPHSERFILKGALMFTVWGAPASRPTRDIDLLGRMNNSVDVLVPVFRDVCQQAVEPDGLVFAVDSIPAIFAVTSDPFIVFTANVFAILGLRAMYFLLADMADRFHLLACGLAIIVILVGCKMLLMDLYKIPITWMLSAVAAILAVSVMASLSSTRARIVLETRK